MSTTEKKEAVPAAPMTIWQAIPFITGLVAPISKDRTNPQQGYKFRGIEDVYAALNLLLSKAGVSIVAEVLDSKHEVAGATKGGSNIYRHTIRVRYTLYASDGSCIKADSEGEGMDSGDKATPKAFSTAFKTMAFQVFCIPTGEKVDSADSDADSEEDSPEVVAQPAKPSGNGHSKPAAPSAQRAAPQVDPASNALVEEFSQGIAQAKDATTITHIIASVAADHKAHRLNDLQAKALKDAIIARRLELGIVSQAAAS